MTKFILCPVTLDLSNNLTEMRIVKNSNETISEVHPQKPHVTHILVLYATKEKLFTILYCLTKFDLHINTTEYFDTRTILPGLCCKDFFPILKNVLLMSANRKRQFSLK